MRFNLAILSVLAARPGERIAIDEVSREVKRMIAAGDEAAQSKRPSELGDADVFQSGWASINDAGLQITDSGLSLWRSLEASRIEQGLNEQETERLNAVASDTRHPGADTAIDQPDGVDLELPGMTPDDRDDRQPSGEGRSTTAPDIPSGDSPIIPAPAFGSFQETNRTASRLSGLVSLLGTIKPKFAAARRRRSAEDVRDRRADRRGGLTGLAVACLSLISVVACVAAAIALGQLSSLKSDIAVLRREIAPLRERLARLEQVEVAKRDAAQQEDAQNKAEAEKKLTDGAGEQAALSLSREEIQLIREYIKAAPSAGAAVAPINVGDPITGGMIPLPSSLTEKLPRLVGARFATRNGAIIISTRNSRRVDAVLMPN
ncbi:MULTISPECIES: hypothetical protein [Bradyrhizobium]|jgi:hypothetical protein|uniref:hypothetical protein n=1 Tax=Bradyrhizobium TaxID=374 RepID=UPI0004B25662|nr:MULTISPECIES: hypothetical protein [Bradyrhizobium]MCS3448368.1 hypothetical protein [Bradyrhizobium elkanii]MCS3560493.1 hypothetical protein [Bradyrhizobium elkanii]MCW2149664.1 hypothetical protein [Bradyrhizobium elkanii]MCW2360369.1 hypothetical protein [Bradyrhizobium elkanii]MCW2373393.1 hypothetical protein [Bradyrhizobium elkanii]